MSLRYVCGNVARIVVQAAVFFDWVWFRREARSEPDPAAICAMKRL